MKANEIERIVSSLDKIPTLPVIYSKLGKLLQSPDTTIAAVSNIISEDQVIAAKVLKFVNSAFYGFPQRVGSLQRAIVILGFNTIKNLVFATSVFDMFRGMETTAPLTRRTSGSTASAAPWPRGCSPRRRICATPMKYSRGGCCTTSASSSWPSTTPRNSAPSSTKSRKPESPWSMPSERSSVSITCQVGSALAVQWRFPPDTAQMIGSHHLGDGAIPPRKDIAAVHIGNILCMALGLGSGGEKSSRA